MNEWKSLSKEESQMLEEDRKKMLEPDITIYQYDNNEILFKRRSGKSIKSKSSKSGKSSSSSSSSSVSEDNENISLSSHSSQDSWGSVELLDEKHKRRVTRKPRVRVNKRAEEKV